MTPQVFTRRQLLTVAPAVAVVACGSPQAPESASASASSPAPSTPHAAHSIAPVPTPSPRVEPVTGRDLDSPDSLTVLVNKHRPLSPIDYAPTDLVAFGGVQLRVQAAEATTRMFAAAAAAGAPMTALSGYRSYATQQGTYQGWVAQYGQAQADVASARPGYSEHQTGLALDIGTGGGCDLQVCFKDTPAGMWAAEHAHVYGFVVRYPWWHHETTGYWYESWHLRFIGEAEALLFKDSGFATLEEFWGTGAAPSYL